MTYLRNKPILLLSQTYPAIYFKISSEPSKALFSTIARLTTWCIRQVIDEITTTITDFYGCRPTTYSSISIVEAYFCSFGHSNSCWMIILKPSRSSSVTMVTLNRMFRNSVANIFGKPIPSRSFPIWTDIVVSSLIAFPWSTCSIISCFTFRIIQDIVILAAYWNT